MCIACYEDEGSPRIFNERTRALAKLLTEHPDWGVGFYDEFHVVLEDMNFDDANVFHPSLPAGAITDALRSMSEAERYSAYAMASGWIEEET